MKDCKSLFYALTLTATFTLALTPADSAVAEDIVIPVGTQADRNHADIPKMGTSQTSVRSSWGEPQAIRGPVGEPPIAQWVYQDFIVYFEGNHVLHTVLKQHRQK
jgi:hypothetical protein